MKDWVSSGISAKNFRLSKLNAPVLFPGAASRKFRRFEVVPALGDTADLNRNTQKV